MTKHRGQEFKARREALRISRNVIAKHLGVSRQSVYLWEDKGRKPRYASIWTDWDKFLTALEAGK